MTFSPQWDDAFQASTHISVWPWSELVSYANRYANPGQGFRRVIELGCGVGANIPFFIRSGVDYYAVEGSQAAVSKLHKAYPQLRENVVVGDFTQALPFEGLFDLIVDRSALTHNNTDAIRRTLKMAHERVRPGGKFLGFDWFSTEHQDATRGDRIDSHTRTNLPPGSLAGLGAVHFSDSDHLIELFATADFRIERLEHKSTEVIFPENSGKAAYWHIVAVKP